MTGQIVIVDYGMSNIHSVNKKLLRIGATAIVTSDPKIVSEADKIVLPGVGHFAKAMYNLKNLGLVEALSEFALVRRKPILGICLGMQVMASYGEEGEMDGLGWINGRVVRFRFKPDVVLKIPHIGWNQALAQKESLMMKDIPDNSEFYFLHSYHYNPECQDTLTATEYGYTFPSAIEKENIFGVQFHPEKSHDAGEQLLRNFVSL